jgi:hypothetical protein
MLSCLLVYSAVLLLLLRLLLATQFGCVASHGAAPDPANMLLVLTGMNSSSRKLGGAALCLDAVKPVSRVHWNCSDGYHNKQWQLER